MESPKRGCDLGVIKDIFSLASLDKIVADKFRTFFEISSRNLIMTPCFWAVQPFACHSLRPSSSSLWEALSWTNSARASAAMGRTATVVRML